MGPKTETYTLYFKGDGEKWSCALPEKKWAGFSPGSKWKASVGVIGGGIDCEALVKP